MKPYLKYLGKVLNVRIYLVDGRFIRDQISVDFTQGGHGYVYDYIPENEVWIDNANLKEKRFIIMHELTERYLMKYEGKSYHQAHNMANTIERRMRK